MCSNNNNIFNIVFNDVTINEILQNIIQLKEKDETNKSELEILYNIIKREQRILEIKYKVLCKDQLYYVFKSGEIKKKIIDFKFIEEIGRVIQTDRLENLLENKSITKSQRFHYIAKLTTFQNQNQITVNSFINGVYSQSLQHFTYDGLTVEEPKIGNHSSISSFLKYQFEKINKALVQDNSVDFFSVIFKSTNIDQVLENISDLTTTDNVNKEQLESLYNIIKRERDLLEKKLTSIQNDRITSIMEESVKSNIFLFSFVEEIGRQVQKDKLNSIDLEHKASFSKKLSEFQNKNQITPFKFIRGEYSQSLQELTINNLTIEEPKIGKISISSLLNHLFDKVNSSINKTLNSNIDNNGGDCNKNNNLSNNTNSDNINKEKNIKLKNKNSPKLSNPLPFINEKNRILGCLIEAIVETTVSTGKISIVNFPKDNPQLNLIKDIVFANGFIVVIKSLISYTDEWFQSFIQTDVEVQNNGGNILIKIPELSLFDKEVSEQFYNTLTELKKITAPLPIPQTNINCKSISTILSNQQPVVKINLIEQIIDSFINCNNTTQFISCLIEIYQTKSDVLRTLKTLSKHDVFINLVLKHKKDGVNLLNQLPHGYEHNKEIEKLFVKIKVALLLQVYYQNDILGEVYYVKDHIKSNHQLKNDIKKMNKSFHSESNQLLQMNFKDLLDYRTSSNLFKPFKYTIKDTDELIEVPELTIFSRISSLFNYFWSRLKEITKELVERPFPSPTLSPSTTSTVAPFSPNYSDEEEPNYQENEYYSLCYSAVLEQGGFLLGSKELKIAKSLVNIKKYKEQEILYVIKAQSTLRGLIGNQFIICCNSECENLEKLLIKLYLLLLFNNEFQLRSLKHYFSKEETEQRFDELAHLQTMAQESFFNNPYNFTDPVQSLFLTFKDKILVFNRPTILTEFEKTLEEFKNIAGNKFKGCSANPIRLNRQEEIIKSCIKESFKISSILYNLNQVKVDIPFLGVLKEIYSGYDLHKEKSSIFISTQNEIKKKFSQYKILHGAIISLRLLNVVNFIHQKNTISKTFSNNISIQRFINKFEKCAKIIPIKSLIGGSFNQNSYKTIDEFSSIKIQSIHPSVEKLIKHLFYEIHVYICQINLSESKLQSIPQLKHQIRMEDSNVGSIVDLVLKTSPQAIPFLQTSDSFINHQDYLESLKMSVIENFLRNIQCALYDFDEKPFICQHDGILQNLHHLNMNSIVSIKSISKTSDSLKVSFRTNLSSNDDELVANDLVLFKLFQSNSSINFVIGIVVESDYFTRFKNGERINNNPQQTVSVLFKVSKNTQDFIDQIYTYFDSVSVNEKLIFYSKITTTVTFQRQLEALSSIKDSPMCDFIISPTKEKDASLKHNKYILSPLLAKHYMNALNDQQRNAVDQSLFSEGITLVHGLTGTGKTHLVLNLISILLAVNPNFKILVCAPSHGSVDEISRRLMKSKFYSNNMEQYSPVITRIGSLENISKDIHPICLLGKESKIRANTLKNTNICLSTLSASAMDFRRNHFIPSIIIIDDATQSCEISTIIPLASSSNVKKLILVGDPVQSLPKILSKDSVDNGINISLFERLSKAIDVQILDTQYRMHPSISHFSSKHFYSGKLKDSPNLIQNNTLFNQDQKYTPLEFYDIIDSQEEKCFGSIKNESEIETVFRIIKKLVQDNPKLKELTIGIITPYKLQRNELILSKKYFNQPIDIEINTIDGFHGVEKDIIIFSCVRSERLGFLNDKSQINIAITRAKYGLFIIGNKNLLEKDTIWSQLIKYISEIGKIQTYNIKDIKNFSKATKEFNILHQESLATGEFSHFKTREGTRNQNEDFNEQYDIEFNEIDTDSDEDDDNKWYRDDTNFGEDNYKLLNKELEQIGGYGKEIQNQIILLLNNNNNESFISNFSKLLFHLNDIDLQSVFKNEIIKKLRKLTDEIKLYKIQFKEYSIKAMPPLSISQRYLNQIEALLTTLKDTRSDINKQIGFERLKKLLEKEFTTADIQLYGSFLYGLSLKGGDLDVCFTLKQMGDRALFLQVKDFLNNSKKYKIIDLRLSATIPIIRFLELNTGTQFDMCFNHEIGIYKSNLIKEYSDLDPRCKELILLVKYWAQQKDINDASKGTFSSFCLVLMVIHFLQYGIYPPILPNLEAGSNKKDHLKENIIIEDHHVRYINSKLISFNPKLNKSTTAQLFYQFFKYYLQFNFNDFAVSITKGPTKKEDVYIDRPTGKKKVKPIIVQDLFSSKISTAGIKTKTFNIIITEISLMEFNLREGKHDLDLILDSNTSLILNDII
ncbi:hypothetical protein DICPUDRAFT_150267 [Dictyostelium purpureum]|uniref:Uncharacterized protein n=1 Tax=Dictyostelium purpureum TaxID=5786 RepID=F0ZFW3_DICPU|nr:uncharacterized protein DICPUDRAFT_150267 [Dictyostelium purpureum]EGC37184.1 hypothetical protein DICPUDRAFT_150267 [Dictyostelium purpureum]|eukprot:XP_003286312.1 hypothetical protein DICPUDRAFT_150267 [Dictyostelium purpureum]